MSYRSLNKVMLIGNLTRDPELKYTANGSAVASFGLATNKSWKDTNGEMQESVQFHNIVAWGKMAEICQQLLGKGMMVYLEGEINTRSWEAEDGSTKYRTEIKVEEMKLLDSKGKQASGGPADGAGSPPPSGDPSGNGGSGSADDDGFSDFEGDPLAGGGEEDDLPF